MIGVAIPPMMVREEKIRENSSEETFTYGRKFADAKITPYTVISYCTGHVLVGFHGNQTIVGTMEVLQSLKLIEHRSDEFKDAVIQNYIRAYIKDDSAIDGLKAILTDFLLQPSPAMDQTEKAGHGVSRSIAEPPGEYTRLARLVDLVHDALCVAVRRGLAKDSVCAMLQVVLETLNAIQCDPEGGQSN